MDFPHEKTSEDGHTMKHNFDYFKQLSKEQVKILNGIHPTSISSLKKFEKISTTFHLGMESLQVLQN